MPVNSTPEDDDAAQPDWLRARDVLSGEDAEDGVGGDDDAGALRDLVATKSRTVTLRRLRGQ
jgi:hypothetical protein